MQDKTNSMSSIDGAPDSFIPPKEDWIGCKDRSLIEIATTFFCGVCTANMCKVSKNLEPFARPIETA